MNLNLEHPFTSRAHRLLHWGHWFTFLNIFIALLISITYLTPETIPDTTIGWVYLLTSWIGHTAFLCFVCFLVTVFPVSFIFPYQKHVRGIAALLATAGVLLLTVDAYAFNKLGYHIASSSVDEIIILLSRSWETHKTSGTLWLVGLTSAILGYELLISNFTWKRHRGFAENKRYQWLALPFLTCFVISHVLHIWADAKGNMDITKQDNLFLLSYPMTAKTLLARYDLLDLHLLHSQKTKPLNGSPIKVPLAFDTTEYCTTTSAPNSDIAIVVTPESLTPTQMLSLQSDSFEAFDKHLQPVDLEDALFSLFFGLPSFYKERLLTTPHIPAWIDVLQRQNIAVQIDILEPAYQEQLSRIYTVIERINHHNPENATHHIHFSLFPSLPTQVNVQTYDNAIFLSLSGKQISSVHKSTLFVKWNGPNRYRDQITTNSGISGMFLYDWFACPELREKTMLNTNIFSRAAKQPRVEFTNDTLLSLHKDKITFIATTDGNTQTYSATTLKPLVDSDNSMELIQAISLLTQLERQQLDNVESKITAPAQLN